MSSRRRAILVCTLFAFCAIAALCFARWCYWTEGEILDGQTDTEWILGVRYQIVDDESMIRRLLSMPPADRREWEKLKQKRLRFRVGDLVILDGAHLFRDNEQFDSYMRCLEVGDSDGMADIIGETPLESDELALVIDPGDVGTCVRIKTGRYADTLAFVETKNCW